MKKNIQTKSGEVAIMLVLIVMLLTTLTTAAVAIAISTTRDTTTLSLGENALTIAESGAESAMLSLLRDRSYTGEASLPIGDGSATIIVTGTGPYLVTSTGVIGNLSRTVRATIIVTSSQLLITNWQEI